MSRNVDTPWLPGGELVSPHRKSSCLKRKTSLPFGKETDKLTDIRETAVE